MKKIAVLSLLVLVAPALALAGPSLPDYEKEAQITAKWACGGDTTTWTEYSKDEPVGKRYVVEVATVKSGETFFLFMDEKAKQLLSSCDPPEHWMSLNFPDKNGGTSSR